MNKKAYFYIGFALFLGIFATTVYFKQEEIKENENAVMFKSCQQQYSFLSPEIDCGTIDGQINQISGINDSIDVFVEQEKKLGKADEISVFFRDLNTRRWFGINEDAHFYPASLAKLPFAMMLYKIAETDKTILDNPFTLDTSDMQLNAGQHYQPAETLETGKAYPLRELLRHLLIFSDNAPINKLMDFSAPLRDSILNDLGVLSPANTGTTEAKWDITAKTYANLFRILYNISYLNPEYSNTLLDELSQSTFKNGLVAGVPEGIKVAHKFGEASETDSSTKEIYTIINDCGIIYKQDSPYILCVMTQGKQYDDLENIIKIISEKAYQSLDE